MSKKYLIVGLVAVIALVNAWLAKTISPVVQIPGSAATDAAEYILPSQTENTPTSTTKHLVTQIIDGDTIDIEIEGETKRVRYIGIDTPENLEEGREAECFAAEATERNRQLVEERYVNLEKDVSEVDKYGRLLRYVYVDNTLINQILVEEGFAKAVTFPPDIQKTNYFKTLEAAAKAAGRGLWGDICTK